MHASRLVRDTCARIGENHVSWNVLCLGMSSSIHPLTFFFALTVTVHLHVRTYARAGRLACARPSFAPALLRRSPSCVLCLDVLYSTCLTPHDPSVFTWMLMFVIPQLAAGTRSLRGDTAALVGTCIPSDMGIRTVYLVLCPTISPATPRSDHDGHSCEPRLDWRLSLQF